MILKSYIVEQNLNILNEYQAVLLYGENDGIKDDVKNKLKTLNSDSEIVTFFENEIIKNKNILYENIINESLFNEKKLIIIQSATDKIFNEILECLEKFRKNIKIYIFCENLDKKSKLRNLFEREKKLAILPCYDDNEKTLINYVSKNLFGYKGLTGEIIDLIITNSGSNRKIIKSEIIKVKDFFVEKLINKEQLLEILNIRNDVNFEEIRDNALGGKKEKTNRLLSEVDLANEESFFYLNNINFRILKLIEIHKANKNFSNYEKTLNNLKPPIFWKDKPVYLEQLKKWNLNKLNKTANKISETEILMKKNSYIRNDLVIKDFIIYLSNEASISL